MSWSRMTPLAISREHTSAAHDRWIDTHASEKRRRIYDLNRRCHERAAELCSNPDAGSKEYQAALRVAEAEATARGEDPDEWIENQCGGCRFYINLEGSLGMDWGACTNPGSEHDGRLMFEHDGCAAFGHDTEPLTEDYIRHFEVAVSCAERELEWVRQEKAEAKS